MVEANVDYWLKASQEKFDTAQKLFALEKFSDALFFLHLSIEKLLKAIYLKKKNEAAPFIHDLVRLAEGTGLDIDEETKSQLVEISTFNIAGRYDDYKYNFYKKATGEYTKTWMK